VCDAKVERGIQVLKLGDPSRRRFVLRLHNRLAHPTHEISKLGQVGCPPSLRSQARSTCLDNHSKVECVADRDLVAPQLAPRLSRVVLGLKDEEATTPAPADRDSVFALEHSDRSANSRPRNIEHLREATFNRQSIARPELSEVHRTPNLVDN
jgi:hypothetical protein